MLLNSIKSLLYAAFYTGTSFINNGVWKNNFYTYVVYSLKLID